MSLQKIDLQAVEDAMEAIDELGFDVETVGAVEYDGGLHFNLAIRATTRHGPATLVEQPEDDGAADEDVQDEPAADDGDVMEAVDEAEQEFRERMDEAAADPDVDEAEVYAEEIGAPGDPNACPYSIDDVETLLEEATIGVDAAAAIPDDGHLNEVTLFRAEDADVDFVEDREMVTIDGQESAEATIQAAIVRWRAFVDGDSIDPDEAEYVNDRRRDLGKAFDLTLATLEVPETTEDDEADAPDDEPEDDVDDNDEPDRDELVAEWVDEHIDGQDEIEVEAAAIADDLDIDGRGVIWSLKSLEGYAVEKQDRKDQAALWTIRRPGADETPDTPDEEQAVESDSSGEDETTDELVLEELEAVHDAGKAWVKAKEIADRLDTTGQMIGQHLRNLQEAGVIERYNEDASVSSWRIVDEERDSEDASDEADVDFWCGYCGAGPSGTETIVEDHHEEEGHPGEPVIVTDDPADDALNEDGPDVDDDRPPRDRVVDYLLEERRDGDRHYRPEDIAMGTDLSGNDVVDVLVDLRDREDGLLEVDGVGVSGSMWRVDLATPEGLTEEDVHAVVEHYGTLADVAEDWEVDPDRAAAIVEAHGLVDELDDVEAAPEVAD